ncbi:MAG: arginine--tRNA ligase [Candidatus Moranbacteria bacterium]|nr:arginine--tRNA ligase [Candidatus Moranbacteria bacterium]
MQKEIINLIKQSVKNLQGKETWSNFQISKIILERPKSLDHGDWTTNLSFQLAKELRKSPIQIAEELAKELNLNKKNKDLFSNIEAMAGYVNFSFTKKYFANLLQNILKNEKSWGSNNSLKNKMFLAEHTDPNLFKELHIGHVMTNTIGESLFRIAQFSGADAKQVTFQGDVGMHVAKTLWGIKNILEKIPSDENSVWEKQAFLGKCYAFGEKNFSSDDKIKKEITKINKLVYNKKDEAQNEIYDLGKKWSLEYFDEIYKLLGSEFDHYFLESSTFEKGEELVRKNIGKVFEESQGAIIFPGSKYGLHDRVFINSEGLPTYEAKDIGLFVKKWEKYNPDISLTVTSDEQKQYFEVVKKAAGFINKEWEEKTVHLAHGTLKLATGKMSSRTGQIIRAKDWVEKTAQVVFDKMGEEITDEKEKLEVAKKVAIGAIKYSILKVTAGKDIVYDEEKSINFEGNSGPYLQYTFVRCSSILKKSKVKNFDFKLNSKNDNVSKIEKVIAKFPESVEQSLKEYSPHYLATYLIELAREFNSFYAKTRILDEENEDYKYNLVLTKTVAIILKNGLHLLGIETVERM